MGAKGEIQNRDRDEGSDLAGIPLAGSLGELPEDLANERGDLDNYSVNVGANTSPDMARAADGRRDERNTSLGSPTMDYTVRSVYDSRPPSAKDFNQWFTSQSNNPNHVVNDFSGLRNCFYVPAGWVAVLRRVSFRCDPTTEMTRTLQGNNAAGAWYDAQLQVLINGSNRDPEVFLAGSGTATSIPAPFTGVPVRDGDDLEVFLIADEGQSIGVLLTDWLVPDGGANVAGQPHINVGFYGNLILKTGRPAMFEPSNLANVTRSGPTTSASDLGEIRSGSEVIARKRRQRVPFANVPILRK